MIVFADWPPHLNIEEVVTLAAPHTGSGWACEGMKTQPMNRCYKSTMKLTKSNAQNPGGPVEEIHHGPALDQESMAGVYIRRPLTQLSERTLNVWYGMAALSGIPGIVLYLRGVYWWAPLTSLAALLSLAAAVLGFVNRKRPLDMAAAAGVLLYAIILGLIAAVGWVLEWS